MIKPEQIPKSVEQKVKALVIEMGFFGAPIRDFEAREIAAATLNAWPGVCIRTRFEPDENQGGQWVKPQPMLSLPIAEKGKE